MIAAPSSDFGPGTYPKERNDAVIAALPLDDVLRLNHSLVDRIQLTFGLDRAAFTAEVFPAIKAYASFVHLLPATASDHFNGPGGLLGLGLEVGFHALQGTDAHIFSGRTSISMRRILEPRWRHATFLAGLCCELHRPLSSLVVVTSAGAEWPAYRLPLTDWLALQRVDRYFVRWRPRSAEARGAALFAMAHVVAPATLQHLDEARSAIVPHLLASVAGVPIYREHNVLDSLVRRSLAQVIERDLVAASDVVGARSGVSTHLERHLVEALRALAASEPTWRAGHDKSRVWACGQGLFIAWPLAAADLQSQLERDKIPGIPKSAESMLDLLLSTGLAEPCNPSEPTWSFVPPTTKTAVTAVKLVSPSLLWDKRGSDETLTTRTSCAASRTSVPVTQPRQARTADACRPGLVEADMDQDTSSQPDTNVSLTPPVTPNDRVAFEAPLRLNAHVRDALAAIIDTLNESVEARAAVLVADGIFVPLAELTRRGVQPALALRALGELSLLVQVTTSPTVTHQMRGCTELGLVLTPRCVAGLRPDPPAGDPAE